VIDWPFLGFLLILLFITVFYKQIAEIIKKGKFKIKYGDTEVSLEQLPDLIEQEIENKLELDNPDKTNLAESDKHSTLEKIQNTFNIKSEYLSLIIFHLGTSKYKWRNQKTLSKRTGLDEDNIEKVVNAYPELIVRSKGKSGNNMYRLTDRNKLLYEEIMK